MANCLSMVRNNGTHALYGRYIFGVFVGSVEPMPSSPLSLESESKVLHHIVHLDANIRSREEKRELTFFLALIKYSHTSVTIRTKKLGLFLVFAY